MIQYIFYIITKVYTYPFVNKVIKKSIMGNILDKTIEYYWEDTIKSEFDEEYVIDYISNKIEYSLCCNSSSYDEALQYIKEHEKYCTKEKYKKIIYAFEDLGDDTNDITETVIKYYGPNKDFYKNTKFKILGEYISDYPIIIITNDMLIYRFFNEDLVDIESDSGSCNINNVLKKRIIV